ncbi:hypothetical protein MtrunA17_Chr3g0086281 [Medicago truncatula]|uniref:Uncharacterized protein n=1 Tax=Medicago truncatula TaxID=3880 RepID=A0A396IN73_MEDTR|nr:hypothetical protein MtrunA17_Chr3g0086281 [Medicago truncatula]
MEIDPLHFLHIVRDIYGLSISNLCHYLQHTLSATVIQPLLSKHNILFEAATQLIFS